MLSQLLFLLQAIILLPLCVAFPLALVSKNIFNNVVHSNCYHQRHSSLQFAPWCNDMLSSSQPKKLQSFSTFKSYVSGPSASSTTASLASTVSLPSASDIAKKPQRKNKNKKWMVRYEQLKHFFNQYGDTDVCTTKKGLGQWVQNQRSWYKKHTNEKGELKEYNEIHQERLDLLNEIGFVRDKSKKRKINNSKWMVQYNQLKEFYKQNGHTFVPMQFEHNKQLGPWVFAQRAWYRDHTNNNETTGELIEPCDIHQERINLMNEIGFVWNPKPGEASNHQWMEKYKELKDFHDENGHLDVTNPNLRRWVKSQRNVFRKQRTNNNKNGESEKSIDCNNDIYQERIRLLNEIGFIWNDDRSKWMAKFNELKEFKNEFGHVNVLRRWKRNTSLGSWVYHQRHVYRDVYTRNDNPEPHQERINLLNEIGLEWDLNSWNAKQAKWMEKYNELKDYIKEHGHVCVPVAHERLGIWVQTQKRQFKTLVKDYDNAELFEPNEYYQERLDLLKKIGFEL